MHHDFGQSPASPAIVPNGITDSPVLQNAFMDCFEIAGQHPCFMDGERRPILSGGKGMVQIKTVIRDLCTGQAAIAVKNFLLGIL